MPTLGATMSGWNHKQEWKKPGTNFAIVVSRHEVDAGIPYYEQGKYRWCVYAYIYPKHWLFTMFDKALGMFEQPTDDMPLHWGVSFFQAHECDGVVTSYQVGCDYNHLHDNHYTFIETESEASSIFNDAMRLFDYLKSEVQP